MTYLIVANNFWGKDDAGVGPLLERMHGAKQTSDELKSFYGGMLQELYKYAYALEAMSNLSFLQLEHPLKTTMQENF